MKMEYKKPEIEILELEAESILAGTAATDNPENPITYPPADESRMVEF